MYGYSERKLSERVNGLSEGGRGSRGGVFGRLVRLNSFNGFLDEITRDRPLF
jgi:hypothetical protein